MATKTENHQPKEEQVQVDIDSLLREIAQLSADNAFLRAQIAAEKSNKSSA